MKSGEASKEDEVANEKQWKRERISDMIDYNNKNPLTSIEEDK